MEDKRREFIKKASARNAATINRWIPIWFQNLRTNAYLIQQDYEARGPLLDAHRSIPSFFYTHGNGCALCIASGPSANQLIKYQDLLLNWKGLVICGPTNAALLNALGRPPDILVAVDSSNFVPYQIDRSRVHLPDCPTRLVVNPYIDRGVIPMFPSSRRFYYKSFLPYREHPMNWYITMLFNGVVDQFMMQAGCTANAEYAFCSLTPDPKSPEGKKDLLIKKVFLLGYDMCYPPHPTEPGRFAGKCAQPRYVEGRGWLGLDHVPPPVTRSRWMTSSNDLFCDQAMIGYKRSLLTLIRILGMPTYQCSHPSIVIEPPFADLEMVLATQGESANHWDYEIYKRVYKDYVDREGSDDEDVSDTQAAPRAVHQLEPGRTANLAEDLEQKATGESQSALPSDLGDVGSEARVLLDGAIHVVGYQTPSTIERYQRTGGQETTREDLEDEN